MRDLDETEVEAVSGGGLKCTESCTMTINHKGETVASCTLTCWWE